MRISRFGILGMILIVSLWVSPLFSQDMQARMIEERQITILKNIFENPSWTVSEKIEAESGLPERVQESRVYYGKWHTHDERDRFIRVVIALIGTPYRLGGTSASGMDCSYFVQCVYQLFDVPLPRTSRNMFLIGKAVEKNNLQEADLIFFNGPGKPSHVGIFIGSRMYAHASASAKMVRVDSIEYPWNNRHYVGAVRVRELESTDKTR